MPRARRDRVVNVERCAALAHRYDVMNVERRVAGAAEQAAYGAASTVAREDAEPEPVPFGAVEVGS
jgi:hypothetical protein